jgi:transposase
MTATTRKNKSYTQQFKEETVALVTEQGYSVTDAASAVGVGLIKSTTGKNV